MGTADLPRKLRRRRPRWTRVSLYTSRATTRERPVASCCDRAHSSIRSRFTGVGGHSPAVGGRVQTSANHFATSTRSLWKALAAFAPPGDHNATSAPARPGGATRSGQRAGNGDTGQPPGPATRKNRALLLNQSRDQKPPRRVERVLTLPTVLRSPQPSLQGTNGSGVTSMSTSGPSRGAGPASTRDFRGLVLCGTPGYAGATRGG